MINDQNMDSTITYPKHACQFCGSTKKLVETVIDDEFVWNNDDNNYEPSGFSDKFEHTGEECCAGCGEKWTGISGTR